MGKSIFEFEDKFGVISPFDDWVSAQQKLIDIDNAEIVEILIEQGDKNEKLFKNTVVYDNLDPAKYRPKIYDIPKVESKTETVKITISVTIKGLAEAIYITVDGNKQRATNWLNNTYAVFEIEVPKKEGKKKIEISAQLTDFLGKTVIDTKKIISTIGIGGNVLSREDDVKEVCPIDAKHRSHFVIHCTAGTMTVASIKKHTNYDTKNKSRSKAHIYVMKDGTTLQIWSFTEKNVWATKAESRNNLKGRMFHVELNYGKPDVPSEEQYNTLADLYIEASNIEKCWPIIVPHIEVDRGIADGHSDPTDFDYNKFYKILENKNVPINDIPKFDHNRYWGNETYNVPWGSDKNTWPPILTGNPHK